MPGNHEQQPTSFWGAVKPPSAETTANAGPTVKRAEALKILDKDSLNLGDINPLIHATNFGSRESVDAVRYTIQEKIKKFAPGLEPQMLDSTLVVDEKGNQEPRFVARFEVPKLTDQQLDLLEELVRQTYGITVRTRQDGNGNDLPTESYPPTHYGVESRSKTGGWYMGPDMSPTTNLHAGLYVFKDLGQVNKDNFLINQQSSSKFIVEIREIGLYQTDLVAFVTQAAAILGQEQMLDPGALLYEVYYDLMRLGLKKVGKGAVYGMDGVLDLIKRGLLTPLSSPDLSRGVREEPSSVLMVGVPGTGKTLVVEQLLNQDTGLFILPIDPLELRKELVKDKPKQKLFSRIAEIARITKKKVVLHIDDIENIVEGDEDTHSTLLNLLAGVRESGFYVIASTNKPEKIDEALMQPQRFGIRIHCGLQNERARFEILKIHADLQSVRLQSPLFYSAAVRDRILAQVAKKTEAFTPRYLAEITRVAKSLLLSRVADEQGTNIDLVEENLQGHYYQLSDWDTAFHEVSCVYDPNETKLKDEALREFVNKHSSRGIGFSTGGGADAETIFSKEVRDEIDALIAIALTQSEL